MPEPDREVHARKTRRVTILLLAAWFGVTFGVGWFARELDAEFSGWPFSFWVGAQGALVVYCLILWYYARYMRRLDDEYGMAEADPAPDPRENTEDGPAHPSP